MKENEEEYWEEGRNRDNAFNRGGSSSAPTTTARSMGDIPKPLDEPEEEAAEHEPSQDEPQVCRRGGRKEEDESERRRPARGGTAAARSLTWGGWLVRATRRLGRLGGGGAKESPMAEGGTARSSEREWVGGRKGGRRAAGWARGEARERDEGVEGKARRASSPLPRSLALALLSARLPRPSVRRPRRVALHAPSVAPRNNPGGSVSSSRPSFVRLLPRSVRPLLPSAFRRRRPLLTV